MRSAAFCTPPSLPPPPRPSAILYSAYQQFDMFLLSSRYNLKFHAFLRGIICVHQSLHIIASAYIIVFIHCTNPSAYSATGYIIVCIQGRASHWFPSGTMSGATRWSSADTISTWLFLTTIAWHKTPTNSVGQTRRVRGAFCDYALCPIFRRWELAAVLQVGPWLAPSPPPLLYAAFWVFSLCTKFCKT